MRGRLALRLVNLYLLLRHLAYPSPEQTLQYLPMVRDVRGAWSRMASPALYCALIGTAWGIINQ